MEWKKYWQCNKNKFVFTSTFIFLAIVLTSFLFFLTYNENRVGYIFNDPILKLIIPKEFSVFTFSLTYSLAIIGLSISIKTPVLFIQIIQAYLILTVLRIICLSIFPLEAPEKIIPLNDPFLENTFYSGRENLKDLFFSGHTATIFLFGLYFNNTKLKALFYSGSFVIGIFLIIQHVHFSIDVAAAPIFSILASRIQKKMMKRIG